MTFLSFTWKSIFARPLSAWLTFCKLGKTVSVPGTVVALLTGNKPTPLPGTTFWPGVLALIAHVAGLRPAIVALTAVMGTPMAFSAVHASTKLSVGSGAANPHPAVPPPQVTGEVEVNEPAVS